jgi:UrcA family protein
MKIKSRHPLMLAAIMLSSAGPIAGSAPALAQQAQAKWRPRLESIIVSAAPMKNWREVLTASHLGTAFAVSASIPVPYSDLDLANELGATELGRRIQIAARLVCQQLDDKYPPTRYPILEGYSGYDCVRTAASDGMSHADMIIASARH